MYCKTTVHTSIAITNQDDKLNMDDYSSQYSQLSKTQPHNKTPLLYFMDSNHFHFTLYQIPALSSKCVINGTMSKGKSFMCTFLYIFFMFKGSNIIEWFVTQNYMWSQTPERSPECIKNHGEEDKFAQERYN